MPFRQLRSLYATFEHLTREVAKFGVVGLVNVAVDVGIFNFLLFHVIHGKPLTDKGISTTVAIISSYFMNRHWTWRDRARTGVQRELPLFLVISGVGLGIAEACLGLSHYVFDLRSPLADNISANVVGLALGMVWRFWAFKRWVFIAPDGERATPVEATARTVE